MPTGMGGGGGYVVVHCFVRTDGPPESFTFENQSWHPIEFGDPHFLSWFSTLVLKNNLSL